MQELNINTTGFNPAYMYPKFPTHDIPAYETIYVECDCSEKMRTSLVENLKRTPSDHDAINIEPQDDQLQQGISND
jgi:hypothetical protein